MKIKNPPLAKNLMEAARCFGNYDLAAALADLIDNSIQARATLVDISFDSGVGNDVVVRIRDNGIGMDFNTLKLAMKPACSNPRDIRKPDDLGRFGWGLKSASFSQARMLTVVSWCNGRTNAARWDLDDIDDWSMDIMRDQKAKDLLKIPESSISGTEVIWTKTDRIIDKDGYSLLDNTLTSKIAHANRWLSIVFQRYLAGEDNKYLNIVVNGRKLFPIDPFMINHNATQTLDAEIITSSKGSQISIQPYILPHFSKLTVEEQELLGGPEGMVRNQGFYVYRNRRLIISGTWFRLIPHSELSQLTRVKIDLPNDLDSEWQVSLDKSSVQLPQALKARLQSFLRQFNKRSAVIHRKKGVNIGLLEVESIWNRYSKHGHIYYRINRNHPIVEDLLSNDPISENIKMIFKLLESYFPIEQFIYDVKNGNVEQSTISTEEFGSIIDQCVINFQNSHSGKIYSNEFLDFIKNIEPFASQWKYTLSYVQKITAKKWGMNDGF